MRAPATQERRTQCPEYKSYTAMLYRCYTPTTASFARYGGRGIAVCDRWRDSFENFLADMGRRPTLGHTLERKDRDKDYAPENCVWATKKVQATNRDSTLFLTLGDETLCVKDWSRRLGLDESTIYTRIKKGWPIEKVLNAACWQHRRATSKTGYKGVYPAGDRYMARISHQTKQVYIGSFETPEAAARAYDDIAVRLHGPSAITNFPAADDPADA